MGSGNQMPALTSPHPRTLTTKGAVRGDSNEIKTTVEFDRIIDITVPDLKPLDNADHVITEKIVRRRIPVRITNCDVFTTANGYRVRVPNAGQATMFGHEGSEHVFSGDDAKQRMLEFVGTVIGQVAYQYRDEVLREEKSEVVQDDTPDGPG